MLVGDTGNITFAGLFVAAFVAPGTPFSAETHPSNSCSPPSRLSSAVVAGIVVPVLLMTLMVTGVVVMVGKRRGYLRWCRLRLPRRYILGSQYKEMKTVAESTTTGTYE